MAGIIGKTKKAVLEQNSYSVYMAWRCAKLKKVFFLVASCNMSTDILRLLPFLDAKIRLASLSLRHKALFK